MTRALEAAGYRVYPLSRVSASAPFFYDQANGSMQLSEDIPLTAVINLAGASIADGRWTQKRKNTIWRSRVETTQKLCEALSKLPNKPGALLSASAIGFYGADRYQPAAEDAPAGNDFLADLSVAWEQATESAQNAGIRTVALRFGLVLSAAGGVLTNLIMPLGLAVVGRLGNGNHLQSWISIDDAVAIILLCLENESFSGALNVVAPEVVSNREFADTMSQVWRRPQLPPMPAAVVRLMFGEVADAALLANSNIRSTRLQELGVNLQHPSLREALTAARTA
ncbi:MAG: TIGR01777 family oxidoreductase [Pseudomonadales bacterium]|nr:TIGR01777 family oxidoreductase [Pseudomonadales bacterium]